MYGGLHMRGGNASLTYLFRDRLNSIYENVLLNSLTLITAPVGYGKTASFRHFLDAHPSIVFRSFTFRQGETDAFWVWNRFNEIMLKRDPAFCAALPNPSLPQTQEDILHYLKVMSSVLSDDAICVVDDYHECDSPFLNKIMTVMAQARIPKLHLVVIGRVFPSFAYEELALKASCLIIDQSDLVFQREEIKQLADLNQISISEQQLDWCRDYSGGWSAAVCLLLNELRQTGRMTHSMSIRELIRSSILTNLTTEMRDVVEQLSVIKTFLPDQAIFLTGNPMAPAIISGIHDSYGFITIREDHVYEISTVLQEAAISAFIRHGHSREEMYLKNALWYEKIGDTIPAIRNYAAANDYDSVIRLMDNQKVTDYANSSPILFRDIFSSMPQNKLSKIWHIFTAPELLALYYKEPGTLLQTRDNIIAQLKNIMWMPADFYQGLIELLQAEYLYQTGNVEEAVDLAQEANSLSTWKHATSISLAASLLIAKCFLFLQKSEQIFHIMPQPDEFVLTKNDAPLRFDFELCGSQLFGSIEGTSGTPHWISAMEIPSELSQMCIGSGAVTRAFASTALRKRQYSKLEHLADELLLPSSAGSFVVREIHGHILKAIALFGQQRTLPAAVSKAGIELGKALDLAKQDHLEMIFAEYGNHILPLLSLLHETPYLARLKARTIQYAKGQSLLTQNLQPIKLTARETDIMELVAVGKTNVQISEELHLARITVEKNLSAIYKKLSVKNRASAIMKYNEIRIASHP